MIRIAATAIACLVLSACAPDDDFDDANLPPEWPRETQGGNGGSQTGTAGDLPCEVAELLETHCVSCHSEPPSGGAPMPLASRAQLVAASYVDAGQNYAERSVIRMRSATNPMPPGPGPTVPASEIESLEAWIAAGMPEGSCGTAGKRDPAFDAPAKCSSNRFEPLWTDDSDDEESEFMQPGRPCIACHIAEEKEPIIEIGGTVYPTGHEPDLCVSPTAEGAIVEITDAKSKVFRLRVNRMGNFSMYEDEDEPQRIARPYKARVLYQGRVRVMKTPQTSGDCNACHTQKGTDGAPGRIVLP